MNPPKRILLLAVALAVGGCAALVPDRSPERDAQHRLDRGLSALHAGHYAEAFDDLVWVYSHCPSREAGSHALVALAALELDPRNSMARPALATELLGRVIQGPDAPEWVRPLAESTYLTALALGAPAADDVHDRDDSGPAGALHVEPLIDDDDHPVDPARVVAPPAPDAEAVHGCGRVVVAGSWTRPALPDLPGPSMARLLAEAESRRSAMATRADTLESRLAAVTEQLEATRAELERIRKTLRP